MPTILVQNRSNTPQYFYVVQQQADFSIQGASIGSSKLSSCLGCGQVGNYDSTKAEITFGLDAQVYAGAISTMAPQPPSQFIAMIATSASGAMVTSTSAAQPVSLSGTQPMHATKMTINPLGLSTPTTMDTLAQGAFAVAVPPYNQTDPPKLYCGNAVINQDGSIVLSSYVAPPQTRRSFVRPSKSTSLAWATNPSAGLWSMPPATVPHATSAQACRRSPSPTTTMAHLQPLPRLDACPPEPSDRRESARIGTTVPTQA
ncbi:MAG: hypothetical protein ACO3C3_13535, partial [Burkholderiaceae bacterium]